jgi:hypothetical protein
MAVVQSVDVQHAPAARHVFPHLRRGGWHGFFFFRLRLASPLLAKVIPAATGTTMAAWSTERLSARRATRRESASNGCRSMSNLVAARGAHEGQMPEQRRVYNRPSV